MSDWPPPHLKPPEEFTLANLIEYCVRNCWSIPVFLGPSVEKLKLIPLAQTTPEGWGINIQGWYETRMYPELPRAMVEQLWADREASENITTTN